MQLDLTKKEFRRLLDLVYIGNWILNSTRVDDILTDYENLESKLFSLCAANGLSSLSSEEYGIFYPSKAFEDGGIHEAISEYEDTVFFEILAEELVRRDMDYTPVDESNFPEMSERIDAYISEFEEHGLENVRVDSPDL